MLVEALIVQLCTGLSGQALEACHKAFAAAGAQSGFTQDVGMFEKKSTQFVLDTAISFTGKDALSIAGAAAKVYRDKSFSYPIRRNSDGLIPSIRPNIGILGSGIDFGWKF